MKIIVSVFAIIFGALSCYAQQAFTVHVVPSTTITEVPAVHSGAFAVRNGKWIFIGGRRDGIHIMQANQAFPENLRNDSIYVVDPLTNSYYVASAHQLPGFMFSAICSSNMQYKQDGQYLYMIGGYGENDSAFNWITFPSLISVDLDCLISELLSNDPIDMCFRQIIDTNLAVTGGALDKIDSTYCLVFGHNFAGRYSKVVSGLFTQHYTHQVRKFKINDDGVNLSVSNYLTIEDTNVYHRRDFNMVPQIYPNHERGFTVFGGVFQKTADQPFLTPIDISSSQIQHVSSFNENLNQYTTATMPVYDSLNGFMHTIFFGGMSLYTLDTVNLSLVQDTLIPFVRTISKVSRDSLGNLTESKIQEDMPSLKGTNAMFIPAPQAPTIDGSIIDINSISGNTLVGYITGGIHSDAPNVADIDPVGMSRPNGQVYEVYIDKNVNAISELPVTNAVNNLVTYPNPVNDNFFVSFSVKNENSCDIKLYDMKGQLIKTLLPEKKVKGELNFSFPMNGIANGVYMCKVRVGESVKVVRVVMSH